MSIRLDANRVIDQVAITLGHYETHMRQLSSSWPDMDLYLNVSAEMDEIRSLSFCVPALSVPLCEMIISHAEVLHALKAACGPSSETSARMLAGHADVIARFRERCASLSTTTGSSA